MDSEKIISQVNHELIKFKYHELNDILDYLKDLVEKNSKEEYSKASFGKKTLLPIPFELLKNTEELLSKIQSGNLDFLKKLRVSDWTKDHSQITITDYGNSENYKLTIENIFSRKGLGQKQKNILVDQMRITKKVGNNLILSALRIAEILKNKERKD